MATDIYGNTYDHNMNLNVDNLVNNLLYSWRIHSKVLDLQWIRGIRKEVNPIDQVKLRHSIITRFNINVGTYQIMKLSLAWIRRYAIFNTLLSRFTMFWLQLFYRHSDSVVELNHLVFWSLPSVYHKLLHIYSQRHICHQVSKPPQYT